MLSFLTGIGVLSQWILIWSGLFPVAESVPGFRNYFISFVIADFWLILAAFLTAAFTLRKDQKAVLFGIALGSAMLFFGLYALIYDLNTGLLFRFTPDELFGKAVTVYNVLGGILFMFLSWKNRGAFGMGIKPTPPAHEGERKWLPANTGQTARSCKNRQAAEPGPYACATGSRSSLER